MSQQAAQAPSEDMFGMPLGRSTASHHPSSAPFAIAPGAEMQAAKRNGLEQEVAASIPPLPPAVHAQLISSEVGMHLHLAGKKGKPAKHMHSCCPGQKQSGQGKRWKGRSSRPAMQGLHKELQMHLLAT